MIIGEFRASLIPLIGAAAGILSILGCYFLSQIYGHEKPFPHTWISATADHYPEYVVFRVGTISGSVLTVLSYFINHFWIHTLGHENVFNVSKYKPVLTLIMGIMASLFLMGSTANLNTGKHNTNWHVACAVNFFLWSIFANVYNTFVITMLYLKGLKGISKASTYLKVVLAILTLIQMYLDLTNRY
jgi:hypothetical protein